MQISRRHLASSRRGSLSSPRTVREYLGQIADDARNRRSERSVLFVLADGDDDLLSLQSQVAGWRETPRDKSSARDDLVRPVWQSLGTKPGVHRRAARHHRRAELVRRCPPAAGRPRSEPMPRPPETTIRRRSTWGVRTWSALTDKAGHAQRHRRRQSFSIDAVPPSLAAAAEGGTAAPSSL